MPIKNKKWRKLIFITVGFSLFIFLFEIFPRLIDLTGSLWKVYSNNEKHELVREYETELTDVKLKNREIKTIINKYVADYEHNLKVSSVISSVDNIAMNTKVKIESLNLGELKKEDNLWVQPIEFNLTGTFENFYNLTRLIENSDKVITIKSFRIKPMKSSTINLDIVLTVDVYLNL